MRILLLGYGFIGKALYRKLQSKHDVLVISRSVSEEDGFIKADLTSTQDLSTHINDIDIIIHTVHNSVPSTSIAEEEEYQNNIYPTVSLLRQYILKKSPRILYISSGGAIYGIPNKDFVSESHHLKPISGYGKSKLKIEGEIINAHKKSNLEYVIIRPSTLFGQGQNLVKKQGLLAHLVDIIKKSHNEFTIWGNGEGRKDYLHVDDLIDYLDFIVENFTIFKNNIFNIGSENHYSINEIVSIAEKSFKTQLKRNYIESPAFDVADIRLDSSKIKQLMSKKEFITIEDYFKTLVHDD